MYLIPQPLKCKKMSGDVLFSGAVKITADDVRLNKAADKFFGNIKNQNGVMLSINVDESEPAEGYKLLVENSGIVICGNSPKGAFWGMQTLRQLINEYGAESLPSCEIEDAPQLQERGFYHDITRGKVPKLDTLKQLVDKLAYFKINSLQLYVEHAFEFKEYEGIVTSENQLNSAEMRELDDYCYENFIELVPSLSTFGHLYHLLQSDKYKHLCELENYEPKEPWLIERMAHHTIDAYNPESFELIKSLIDQYIPHFRSNRFNICCDETFDLCNGRNKGKDKAEAYFYFLIQIIEYVQKCGKQVMMWGDILLNHPELFEKLPKDIVVLNWDYSANPYENRVQLIADMNQPQILCPGTSSWNYVMPDFETAKLNITCLAKFAKQYNSSGILNTNWGDYGNIGSLMSALYPMAIGAAVSWNTDTEIDDGFKNRAALHLFGDKSGVTMNLLCRLSDCEIRHPWANLCLWYGRGINLPFKTEELENKISECNSILQEIINSEQNSLIDKDFANDIRNSCRTTAMIYGMLLSILENKNCLPENFTVWQQDYSTMWLKENKKSELTEILELVSQIKNKIFQ